MATTIEITKKDLADYINSRGVHYEFCTFDSDTDREFVENLDDLDPEYINDNLIAQSGSSDLRDIAAYIVEAAYLKQTGYSFVISTSIIALN